MFCSEQTHISAPRQHAFADQHTMDLSPEPEVLPVAPSSPPQTRGLSPESTDEQNKGSAASHVLTIVE